MAAGLCERLTRRARLYAVDCERWTVSEWAPLEQVGRHSRATFAAQEERRRVGEVGQLGREIWCFNWCAIGPEVELAQRDGSAKVACV